MIVNVGDISPIFITGGMRTGSTLISRILNNHPNLDITYDSIHFMRFCIDQFDPIDVEQNYTSLLNNIGPRVEKRLKAQFDVVSIVEALKEIRHLDYAQIYNVVMNKVLLTKSGNRWGEKSMMCWTKIPRFLEMFPNGKVVHMLRDPRDVVASLRLVTTEPGLRYLNSIFTEIHSMDWAKFEGAKLKQNQYIALRYEDLVRNPVETVERLCEVLAVPFEKQMLDHRKFVDRTGHYWRGNSSYQSRRIGIDPSSVGAYKQELSNVEIFFVEMVCRERMKNFDYMLEGRWLTESEWKSLYEILSDDFIQTRLRPWLQSNQGTDAYPTSPPQV